jgi:hypothetical protein
MKTLKSAFSIIVLTASVVAGVLIIPRLFKRYEAKMYKLSLKRNKIDISDLEPVIAEK